MAGEVPGQGEERGEGHVHLLDDELADWWHHLTSGERAALLASARSDEPPPTAVDAWIWAAVLDSHLGRWLRTAAVVAVAMAVAFLTGLCLHLFAPDEDVAGFGLTLALILLFSSWSELVRLYRLDRRRRSLLAMASLPQDEPRGTGR